jgi:16S rRNA (adenine1518-N6/adenine1519-N6)-dimethyltransferase
LHARGGGVTIGRMPGQTLTEIRELLAGAGLTPRHRFGQNFLIDLNLMRKVVAAGDPRPADTILEVGPGTGSLTELLLDSGARVVACEIDHGLQTILTQRLGSHERFTLVAGDALAGKAHVNPALLDALRTRPPRAGGACKLIANLPYQIATPLLINLLMLGQGGADELRFERLACTIQKEVGERLVAAAGSEHYGIVSVLTATLAEARIVAHLPPTAFWPRPEVDSALVLIRARATAQVDLDDLAGFAAFVQRGFQQRRKTLRRILRELGGWRGSDAPERAGLSGDLRPERLSPSDWRSLYRAWSPSHH